MSVAGWDQSIYKTWFGPSHEGPDGGPAEGAGLAVRVGRERCASVAHRHLRMQLPGSGPFVKWIALSVEVTGVGKSTSGLASMYVLPQGAMRKARVLSLPCAGPHYLNARPTPAGVAFIHDPKGSGTCSYMHVTCPIVDIFVP